MKTIGTWLTTAVLIASAAGADELRLEVAFEQPLLSQTPLGDVLDVPGARLRGRPGEPLLPQKTFTFVLPQGHRPAGLSVESVRTEALAGTFEIAPAQLPVPLSGRFRPRLTPRDALVYASGDPLPGDWAEIGPVQYKRGYALLEVAVHPLSYRPASGRVVRLASATLVLATKPGAAVSRMLRATADDQAAVLRRADVAVALSSYLKRPTRDPLELPPGDYPYLIVAPEAFLDIGGEFGLEALRDARTVAGMPGNIVTVEWIRANYDGTRPDGGQDDATRIRDFLTDAYLEWNTAYVLLVGDADAGDEGGESGDNLLPVRGLYVNPSYTDAAADNLPADMYYSCLDGTFDRDGDGIYGEASDGADGGMVDLMAELYVGRAPVDSVEEVQNFVAKTLYYEAGAGTWLQQVLMLGELLWDEPMEIWGGDFMDELITGSSEAGTLGFNSNTFFECTTLYDRDLEEGAYWNELDLLFRLNAGPHIVNHLGHSNNTYNMRLMNHNVDELINVHPFLHYSQGCYNGAFDNSLGPEMGNRIIDQDCIAEHLVAEPHGAFATVSNSRYGWGSIMSDSPSQLFHREFWDAFFGEGMSTIGEALVDSKEDNASGFSDPITRWVGYESNLLGDPAAALKKSLNTTDPLIGVYPPQVSFISMLGEDPPAPATLGVRNDGVGSLSFTAQSDQGWLVITPDAGDAPLDIQVQVDPTGLQPGDHQAVITFESAEAANSPIEMAVDFSLVEVPQILVPHVTEAPVLDGVISPGEYDQALSFIIDPDASGHVVLYLAVSGTRFHVAVDDYLDVSNTDFDQLRIFFDKYLDGVWPTAPADEGYYYLRARETRSLNFSPVFNSGAGAQEDRHYRERDPAGFAGKVGFVDEHRVYEASLDMEISHLDVGAAGEFGLYLDASNSEMWTEGTITGSWPRVVPEIDDQMYFGRVDLTPQEAWLHASPGDLYFEAVTEREAPEPAPLVVSELLGGSVSFTASSSVEWLQVSPSTGQTPQGLTVTADQAGLEPGSYQGEIVLESTETGNARHTVTVTFEVLPLPARLAVDPASLSVAVTEGDVDPTLELTISNVGGKEMEVALWPSEGWVSVVESFVVSPGADQTVVVWLALSGLGLGTHPAEILVEARETAEPQEPQFPGDPGQPGVGEVAEDSPVTVPVELEIVRANTAPPAPQLLAPADGSELYGPIDLMAYPVVDPERDPVTYQFELMVADTGDAVESGAGVADGGFVGWRPAAQLEEEVLYRWRVKAIDNRGAGGQYSEEWTFMLVKPPGSDGCGCAHSRPSMAGLVLMLLGLAGLRINVRRR